MACLGCVPYGDVSHHSQLVLFLGCAEIMRSAMLLPLLLLPLQMLLQAQWVVAVREPSELDISTAFEVFTEGHLSDAVRTMPQVRG